MWSIFIMRLWDEAWRKKRHIFRSLWNPFLYCRLSKTAEFHSSLTRERETLESNFMKASTLWVYKYHPSPLLNLDVYSREHLIGTIKHHHCHIDPVLSTGWLVWAPAATITQTWGTSERLSQPQKRCAETVSSPLAKPTDCSFWQQMFREFSFSFIYLSVEG